MSVSHAPQHVHCVGVGGIGMSGLALLLLDRGHSVSGSDIADSAMLQHLRNRGVEVHLGHAAAHVEGADLLVCSSSIAEDNPEVQYAKVQQISIQHRSQALADVIAGQQLIAVSGAHGKTTTTAMIAQVLSAGQHDPSYVIGAEVASLRGHAVIGAGPYCVLEADESDGSLLNFHPDIAVITNIDQEHLDYYHTFGALKDTFRQFLEQTNPEGSLWLCADDTRLKALAATSSTHVRTFGMNKEADVTAWLMPTRGAGCTFAVHIDGVDVGEFQLQVPGAHNVSNALAAIGIGYQLGVSLAEITSGLEMFSGARRRFQRHAGPLDMTLIDDYAHHPTEIRATLAAIQREPGQRLVAVFQPHRYSRTHLLQESFARCFTDADHVIVTDIYAASEEPIPGVSAECLVDVMQAEQAVSASYVPRDQVVSTVCGMSQQRDIIIFFGAGDIGELYRETTEQLPELSAV
jgi:UDP-N-acetylmuramate--alanine ligase